MTASGPWDPLEHLVRVTVATRGDREVEVRLADGRPGVIPLREFPPTRPPAVGDEIPAVLLTRDDPRGRAVLSHAVAAKLLAWQSIQEAHAAGEPIRGEVSATTKGGFVVDVGVRAFMPASMARGPAEEGGATEDLVGRVLDVAVVELDRDRERVVVSRRDVLRREERERRRRLVAELAAGQEVAALVTQVADFGLLVDLDGVRALVPRGELDWDPRRSPPSVGRIGEEIRAVVLDVDEAGARVRLSIKRRAPDPFALVAEGDRLEGRVSRVVDYGAFIEVLDGALVGLCHVSELTDDPRARADELVVPGDVVAVKVLGVDRRRRRISLSVTQGVWG